MKSAASLLRNDMLSVRGVPEIWNTMNSRAEELRPNVAPKSTLGKAVNYFLNDYHALAGYLNDGRFEIDNNLVENAIGPTAVGRNRWLFEETAAGNFQNSLGLLIFTFPWPINAPNSSLQRRSRFVGLDGRIGRVSGASRAAECRDCKSPKPASIFEQCSGLRQTTRPP